MTDPERTSLSGQIERAEDPKQVADLLPGRIESLRAGSAESVDVDPADIPTHDLISSFDLSRAAGRYIGDPTDNTLRRLGRLGGFELGRKIGHREADPLTAIYRAVLGREPDAEGLAFWRGVYEDGMPLSGVIRHIEQSPEARAGESWRK